VTNQVTQAKRLGSVVIGDNADLMAHIAPLYLYDRRVLDVTYGKGNFWTKYRPRLLVPYTGDFLYLPTQRPPADVVVFDPPQMSTGTRAKSTIPAFYASYGLGDVKGWRACFRLIAKGMKEAIRTEVMRPKGMLMVKCSDNTESGHKHWGSDHVTKTGEELGLEKWDELVLVSGTGAQPLNNLNGKPRTWQHSHAAHSFLIVFKIP
jgi:hypothetical protein